MPFNSTTHFHLMVALEQAKINPADVQILNMRPPEVRAAWQRGDIQATFIWDPVLAEVKKDGKVIITSGKISAETGKATFDGYVVNKDWAKENRDFMVKFVKVMAAADDNYRENAGEVDQGLGRGEGGREVVGRASPRTSRRAWRSTSSRRVGAGDEVAGRRRRTAPRPRRSPRPPTFQLSQKQIEKTLPDYSVAVNPSYAADAAK